MRFPAAVHAASSLTSSSHAHDDELGCHRLAAGGGLGGLRATSFISSDRSLLRDTSGVAASAFSVFIPTPVHAASPLTSSSHAHDDELGCHRLAAGGGLGGLRATSFISSDRSLLRDTSGAPALALLCPHSGSFFSVSFSWRRARCFSPYQQPKRRLISTRT